MAKNPITEVLSRRSDEEKSPRNLTTTKKTKTIFSSTNKMVGQKGSRSIIKLMAFKSQRISSNSSLDLNNRVKDSKRTNSNIRPNHKATNSSNNPSRFLSIRTTNRCYLRMKTGLLAALTTGLTVSEIQEKLVQILISFLFMFL